MRTLFVTTPTVDCFNHFRAYSSLWPAERVVINYHGVRLDEHILYQVRSLYPDVIFYIAANEGLFNLRPGALKDMRNYAPTINLCSDAADAPWHRMLMEYKEKECFDLQVSLDGGRYEAIDHTTLTPVDASLFEGKVKKDIRCGFSGSVGLGNPRGEIILALEWLGGLTVRKRADSYTDHIHFMKRCKMVLNTSWTGTGKKHHIKGRVIETGLAGACLLEYHESPIDEWFPEDCYIKWRDAREAADLIKSLDDPTIAKFAGRLAEEVKKRYNAMEIYSGILTHVGITQPGQAA